MTEKTSPKRIDGVDDAPLAAGRFDHRMVSVMFVDIVNSTPLVAGKDPDVAQEILRPVLNAIRRAVLPYEATIQLLGDGLMAVFGSDLVREDHAIRACHAGLHSIRAIQRLERPEIQVRVGIHSGFVLVQDDDVIGDTVHFARRLESVAAPGAIAISSETAELVRSRFEIEPVGEKLLKGFPGRYPVFHLGRPIDRASEIPTTLFVGRRSEIATIDGQFRALIERKEGSLILIDGEPGVGKSRLVQEMNRKWRDKVVWLAGQAASFDQRVSYASFIPILKRHFLIRDDVTDEMNWDRLKAEVFELAEADVSDVLPYLASLLGIEVRGSFAERVRFIDAEGLGRQILRAFWLLLEHLCARQAVIVVLEDLHWIDGSSQNLLEHVTGLVKEAPLIFCITSRPSASANRIEAIGAEMPATRFCRVRLAPLTDEECGALIDDLVKRDPLTKAMREEVVAKVQGNPFFAEEMLRLIAHAALDHRQTPLSAGPAIHLPSTIHGVIMGRIDRLEDQIKDVLAAAALIGRNFTESFLRALLDEGAVSVEKTVLFSKALAELVAVGLIEEQAGVPERAYRFRHPLVHEAVYQSSRLKARKLLHERLARWVENSYADRLREFSSLLAFHYTRAENWIKAVEFLLIAGEQSARLAADQEALLNYEEAIAAYDRGAVGEIDKTQRAIMEQRLGGIHLRRANHDRAESHLLAAASLCGVHMPRTKLGTAAALTRELFVQGVHRLAPWRLPKLAAEIGSSTEAIFRILEDLCWAFALIDNARLPLGIVYSLNRAEKCGFPEAVCKGYAAIGLALTMFGRQRVAKYYLKRAVGMAEEIQNPSAGGTVWYIAGWHDFVTGDWAGVEAALRKSRGYADRAGDLLTWYHTSLGVSEVLADLGRFDEMFVIADEAMTRGQQAAFAAGYRWGLLARAKALRYLGRAGEAEPLLREAVRGGRSRWAPDVVAVPEYYSELALCVLDAGDHIGAAELIREYEQNIDSSEFLSYTVIYPLLANAVVLIRQKERTGDSSRELTKKIRASVRSALRACGKFRNGLPAAYRVAGTAAWLEGRREQAGKLWHQSSQLSKRYGAHYQASLTLVESGRRMQAEESASQGLSQLKQLGVQLANVDRAPLA